jgi:hypothetical protein
MKALGANAGDYVLVDVLVPLLENDEHRAVSASMNWSSGDWLFALPIRTRLP